MNLWVEIAVFTTLYVIGLVVHACHAAHRKKAGHKPHHRHRVHRHGFAGMLVVAGQVMWNALQDYALHFAEYVGHWFAK